MQFRQFSVLSIFSVLVTSTFGRPSIESSNSMQNVISNSMSNINSLQTDRSSTKRPLSSCEEAIFSCCSDQWSTFLQSARCFELNNCPGINFIANPCFRLSAVINRIWSLRSNSVPYRLICLIVKYLYFLLWCSFSFKRKRICCHSPGPYLNSINHFTPQPLKQECKILDLGPRVWENPQKRFLCLHLHNNIYFSEGQPLAAWPQESIISLVLSSCSSFSSQFVIWCHLLPDKMVFKAFNQSSSKYQTNTREGKILRITFLS